MIEAGEHTTETELTDGTTATMMLVEFETAVFCVDAAVMAAVPAADGVNSPDEDIDPPTADQLTCELKFPIPATEAIH
jgi:hypothetical protein